MDTKLTPKQLTALKTLETINDQHHKPHAAYFGDLLWPGNKKSGCSCPMARPAGKILRALERLELATIDRWQVGTNQAYGWTITNKGRDVLRNKPLENTP